MKKFLALLLALVMCLALVACGDNAEPDNTPADNVPVSEPEGPAEGDDATTTADWYDFADIFNVSYYGLTEAGETVVFVLTEDSSFAALAVADTDTMESASWVGAMTPVEFDDGTTGYSIADENNDQTISFSCEFYEDGSVALDLGDYGAMAIMTCEQSEAFDLLNAIDAETIAIA